MIPAPPAAKVQYNIYARPRSIITTVKHPVMAGCEREVQAVLENPEEIRRSKSDANVYLFYRSRRARRWVCAVSKQEGRAGFLISVWLETRIDRVGVGFGADVGVRMLAGRLNICRDSSV